MYEYMSPWAGAARAQVTVPPCRRRRELRLPILDENDGIYEAYALSAQSLDFPKGNITNRSGSLLLLDTS